MNPDLINGIGILITVLATLITAVITFRSSEASSKYEGIRTNLEVTRMTRETNYDQVIQGAQTLNMMSTGLIEHFQTRLREVEMSAKECEMMHDELTKQNIEIKMYLTHMMEIGDGLITIAEECEIPNGGKDRIHRLTKMIKDLRGRGIA